MQIEIGHSPKRSKSNQCRKLDFPQLMIVSITQMGVSDSPDAQDFDVDLTNVAVGHVSKVNFRDCETMPMLVIPDVRNALPWLEDLSAGDSDDGQM
jgi:hypothetical protein